MPDSRTRHRRPAAPIATRRASLPRSPTQAGRRCTASARLKREPALWHRASWIRATGIRSPSPAITAERHLRNHIRGRQATDGNRLQTGNGQRQAGGLRDQQQARKIPQQFADGVLVRAAHAGKDQPAEFPRRLPQLRHALSQLGKMAERRNRDATLVGQRKKVYAHTTKQREHSLIIVAPSGESPRETHPPFCGIRRQSSPWTRSPTPRPPFSWACRCD